MAVRDSMAALLSRVRLLINDPAGASQTFADQDIQDVLDESREDIVNGRLIPKPTFTGGTISYLNYYSDAGGWEDDYVLKQYLTMTVTPSSVEPITGHFVFATTTLPPLYITGKLYDVYCAAADLLERMATQWLTAYNISVDGQNLQRSQVAVAMRAQAQSYRAKQRPTTLALRRTDVATGVGGLTLKATEIDYMATGDGR